jgi:hypothetical protein
MDVGADAVWMSPNHHLPQTPQEYPTRRLRINRFEVLSAHRRMYAPDAPPGSYLFCDYASASAALCAYHIGCGRHFDLSKRSASQASYHSTRRADTTAPLEHFQGRCYVLCGLLGVASPFHYVGLLPRLLCSGNSNSVTTSLHGCMQIRYSMVAEKNQPPAPARCWGRCGAPRTC